MSRATQAARRRRPDDPGVSTVLGAVLMFGLLIVTLITIQFRFVPIWEQDRQASHMEDLAGQMRLLKSDLDRQSANDTSGPLSDSFQLRKEGGFRFFQGSPSNAQMAFVPAPNGTGITITTCPSGAGCAVHLVSRGGQPIFGLTDAWTTFTTATIANVASVQNLRVRVDLTPPSSYAHGDNATLTIYGAANSVQPLGRAVFTFLDFSSEQALQVQIFDAAGKEVSSDIEAFFQQTVIDWLYFDLLRPELLLPQVLATGQPPYRFELAQDNLLAQYQIAYVDSTQGPIGGAAGVALPTFTTTIASGRLDLTASNPDFVDQTYTLEHGGVVLSQGNGSVVSAPPAFQAVASPSVVSLTWTVPALTGQASNRVEAAAAAIITPTGAVDDPWLLASRITFTLPTPHGAGWCTYFDTLLSDAGLSRASGQYTVTVTSAQCSITIYGPVSSPTSTTEDISLHLRASTINLATTFVG
jgi:hypothetical protein